MCKIYSIRPGKLTRQWHGERSHLEGGVGERYSSGMLGVLQCRYYTHEVIP